ncbi:adenylate kinase family protein [Calycomorphotria hydatis]|uniref:Adenylate kinase n=1 Tax=Calycomorphotria hydatis TaxID=2528027 RepID=A0A517TE05_9PLAN|nr:nucleoside monophosphate kinase [Calycomorphotria hydatis]QDT66604.1 Adenylate kinase [Calycomorphotria hydatis]
MAVDGPYKTALLFGAPGVGKGTQGKILGLIPGFFHLSSGDVFRSIDIQSDEGQIIYSYISRGELVPDDLTIKIWKKALEAYIFLSRYKPREDILILDGLPRNVHQAEMIADILDVRAVMHLVCSDLDQMIDRIKRRAIRESRIDDANEDIIRHRFEVYENDTAPVLNFYPNEVIHSIDALGSPAMVLSKVLEVCSPVQEEIYQANLARQK